MRTLPLTIVATVATATSVPGKNPCRQLCEMDGPNVCTNGSYPRTGEICHGYFMLPSGDGYCYHNPQTVTTCPHSLQPLYLSHALFFLTSPTTTTSHAPTTLTDSTPNMRRRHLVETTTTPAATTSHYTEFTEHRRRVFVVNVPTTVAPVVAATAGPNSDRRQRCFPGGAAVLAPSLVPAIAPMSRRQPIAQPYNVPTPMAGGFAALGTVLSDISLIAHSDIGDAASAWEMVGGPRLLARAIAAPNCITAYDNQNTCFAVILLASKLPRSFIESQSDLLAFIQSNAGALGRMLLASGPESVQEGRSGSKAPYVGFFAQNWISAFPEIFQSDQQSLINRLKAIVVRHRIGMYSYRAGDVGHQPIAPHVNRGNAFEDSSQYLTANPARVRRGLLSASFEGEAGVGEGVRRDWFTAVSEQLYADDFGLFERSEAAPHYTRISEYSNLDENFRYYFRAIGRLMALSIIEGNPIGVYFPDMFYKRLLGRQVELEDIRDDEPEYYRSFEGLLGMSDEDLEAVDAPVPHSGSEDLVNAANREEQIQNALQAISINNKDEQFAALREGFSSALPDELFEGIEPREVGAFIAGDSVISIDDLERNYRLAGYTATSPQVRNLFTILRELSQDDLRKFLRFVTSSTQVPLGGFGVLEPRFQIQRMARTGASGNVLLPATHTCFNTIDLPEYENIDELRVYVLRAINLDSAMGII